MRRGLLFIVIAAGIWPAAAGATPTLKLLAAARGPFVSIAPAAGFYSLTSQQLRIASPSLPRGRAVAVPHGCTTIDVSLPKALIFCEQGPSYALLDVNSDAVAPVDASSCGEPQRVTLDDLGRHWIGGRYLAGYDAQFDPIERPIYFSRQDGRCLKYPVGSASRDVDRSSLPRRRRASCRDEHTRRVFTRDHGDLFLAYCHSQRRRLRLCKSCGHPQMGTHSVAWLSSGRIGALVLPSKRRYSWRVAALDSRRSALPELAFLRDRLYVTLLLVPSPDEEPPYRIFSAALR